MLGAMNQPPEHPSLYPTSNPAVVATKPFDDDDLRAALWHPALAIDVLLAQRRRWTASVVDNQHWARMVALLLWWTLWFSLPYGLVLSVRLSWQIGTLFLGSVALCLPSLHVATAYLGLRVHLAQSFAFATIVAAVAAIFSCAFAPILWFLQMTTDGPSGGDTVAGLSSMLLGLAGLAGIAHGMRCLRIAEHNEEDRLFGLVVVVWQLLLIFIGLRMSTALGLS